MDNKIIAISLVSILLVAGVAAAFVLTSDENNSDETPKDSKSDCNLWVYGNVNGDNYIDQRDIDLLQDILDKKAYEVYITAYDGYSANNNTMRISLADANQDGKLNASDITKIKEIIDYQKEYSAAVNDDKLDAFDKKMTVYYNNCDNFTAKADLPIKTLISMYFSNSEVVRLLGAVDRVIGTDDTTLNFPTLLPEFQGLPDIGSRYNINSEAVLKTGADAYFTGSASTYSAHLEQDVGNQMNVIRLSAWEDNNVMVGTLTLGYLLGCTDMAYKYIDWCHKYMDLIEDRVKSINGNVTLIVPKGRGTCLEGNGPGSGQFEISEMAGGVNLAAGLPTTSEYPQFTQEWALTSNIDFVILSGYCGIERDSPEQIKERVDDVIASAYKTYEGTPAATNGHIYFICNEIFTGPSNIISLVYCAQWMYPELFSDLDGEAVHQEFFDLFCPSLKDYDLKAHMDQFVKGPQAA